MGSERRPHNPATRSSSAIGKLSLIGVVYYPFVEKNRSSHFGFVSTSLRPLGTSVPQPVSKLTCRRCRSRQRTKKKPPNGIRQTDKPIWELTVVTTWWSCGSNNWSPGGASWLKKSVADVPYSGGARASRARILFDDPSRSAGSENEAQRKGYAVKSAKLERCTQGKGADCFQK